MRLHHLEVSAFGPFAGHEQVDFDELTASGLFLLCGPTGAGKTSLLDAVSYALFGAVPGDRDKAKRLHSDHAAAGTGPRVVLEVTVRGRLLRVTRSPEWMRPKKRGTGEIREHAKVLVEERVDGQWQQRTNRIDEAADFLGSLLGLTMSQFCQVALLPQGRFETFLRSGAQERHTLLERLFGTHRFRAVEDWLADHRRRLAAQASEHRDRVAGILERAAEAAGEEREDDLGPEAVLTWFDALRDRALAMLTDAGRARAEADQFAKDRRAAYDAMRDLADLQARHRDAVGREADLRALHDGTERMGAEVARARRAEQVGPFVEIGDRARARVERADRAVAAAEDDVRLLREGDGVDGCPVAPYETQRVTEQVRRSHEENARLQALRPTEQRIREITSEISTLDARAEAIGAERSRSTTQAHADEAALDDMRAQRLQASQAAERLGALRERLPRAVRTAEAAAAIPAARRQTDAACESRDAASEEALQARESWLDLRQARLDGIAAELARDLSESTPCPVCGSPEHPAPAADTAATVSPEAEAAAEQTWRDAEARRQRLGEDLSRCERELAGLHAEADGADPVSARETVDAIRSDLERAEEAAVRLATLEREISALTERATSREARLAALHTEQTHLDERRAELRRERAELQESLVEALGDAERLSDRLAAVTAETTRWETLLDRLREQQDAAREADDAHSRLTAAVAEAGFADLAEVRAAAMSPTDLSNTETLLRRRADQAAQVRAVLDDPRVVEAASRPPADIAPLADALEHAERARDEAVAAERSLEHRAHRLDHLHRDLHDALAQWRPVADSLGVAERLATLCAGTSADNRHKMRLSAYVLAARLEQVVAAANERLARMSAGRYALEHSVARGVGDRRGGLGLRVHDSWTGEVRDPATLSGGETFFTSLALALGLADVVTHEAGGTEIGTMFVDEGFGSLDPDTLDEVMDVLDQLRSGGRAVGIVSHVGDLQTRIPAQVHVLKDRTGSTLRGR